MSASPLHATRAGVGGAWCLALGAVPLVCEHPLVLVAVLAVEALAAAGRGPRARAAPDARRGAFRSRSRVMRDQRARHARRGDGRLPRPAPPVAGADRHHARGAGVRRRARAADPGDLRDRGVPDRGGRRRRAAARPAADLAAQRGDGGARDAAVRRPAPRRGPARRRAALPSGRRRVADRGPARGHRRARWTGPPTSPRRWRSAASAPAAARRGCRARGRATTSRSRRARSRCWRSASASLARPVRHLRAVPAPRARGHARDVDRDRGAVRLRAAAVRRPPGNRRSRLPRVPATQIT